WVYDTSSKETLVLIMGFAGSLHSWPRSLIEELSAKYKIVLLDNRGTGKSIKPKNLDEYTIEKMADDVIGVVDDLKLDSFYLLGWSLGGCIALEVAHRIPKQVKKLVLVSAMGGKWMYVPPPKELLEKLVNPQGETLYEIFLDGWSTCL